MLSKCIITIVIYFYCYQVICFIITIFQYRQSLTKKAANKYINKVEQKMVRHANKPEETYDLNPTDEIFKGNAIEKAAELKEKLEIWEKKRKPKVQNQKIKKKKVKETSVIAKPVQKMKFMKSKVQKKKKVK